MGKEKMVAKKKKKLHNLPMHSTSQAFNTVDKCIAETNITTLQTYCFLHGKLKHKYIITEVDSHRIDISDTVHLFLLVCLCKILSGDFLLTLWVMTYFSCMNTYEWPFKTINSLNMNSIVASRFSSISKAIKYTDTQSAVNDNTNSG